MSELFSNIALCLSSSEPAVTREYQWTQDVMNSLPVFKQVDKNQFLFVGHAGGWKICSSTDEENCSLVNPTTSCTSVPFLISRHSQGLIYINQTTGDQYKEDGLQISFCDASPTSAVTPTIIQKTETRCSGDFELF